MAKTPFASLSQAELDSRFQSAVWDKLPGETRLALCQELENRMAASQGLQPRTVTALPMDGAQYGYQQGDTLCLNAHLIQDGVFRTVCLDENHVPRTFEIAVPAAGWNTYDTLGHEHTHGLQLDQGRAQTAASYISGDRDYALYRIQPDEREAFSAGQRQTLAAIARVEAAAGQELPEKGAYLAAVEADSYEAALAQAQMCYGSPQVQEVLDQVVTDRELGVAPESPSPLYADISQVYEAPHQSLDPQARAEGPALDDGSTALAAADSGAALQSSGQAQDDGSAALTGQDAGQDAGQGGPSQGGASMDGGMTMD